MSNKYTDGLDQRYIQAFQGKDDKGNVKGSFGSADRGRYDAYTKATKGLDKDLAFKSLGGMNWGKEDQGRYDTALAERNKSQADAKAKAQAHQKSSKNNVDSSTNKPAKAPNQSPNANSSATSNQTQTVTQDNDINTDINGDYNTVVNNQDNSIRQYGGNTKSFTYNGGKGMSSLYDSPVSAGTMGGFFYDEDSPASSASFMDRYTTMNKDLQKKYSNTGIAATAIGNARNNKAVNVENLDKKIDARAKASRARSTVMAGSIFGDMFNYKPVEFNAPAAPDPIKVPNFGK
jgi:hypothetical protein